MNHTIDITPTPRILRTLGDIPFEVWQCLAELSDNSLDAFREQAKAGTSIDGAKLDIVWSKENVAAQNREIMILDNGPGMSLGALQNAARAGYSSNDPINNLGLFGMGFNIATARLGEETIFLSATLDSQEWSGISIDFSELIRKGAFEAPIITETKKAPDECGTKIIVRRLREGIYSDLKTKESAIRRRLEIVYSAILEKNDVEIFIQGKALKPLKHCVWGASRFVMHKGIRVSAVQEIDIDLGNTWFDTSRNRYLSEIESGDIDDQIENTEGEKIIVKRPRRLRGWLGIQRFNDTSEFGIDFIRNGRKIIVGNKSLFSYENPDTGTMIIEYPVELGSTVGGRIIGELHVDYLIPTYQKNSFDTSDKSWRLTVDAIRGAGPILPKRRQALGYSGDNNSPLGILVNSYRRPNPGTKCLTLSRDVTRNFLNEFRKGNPEYQNDERWYKAAQEEDRTRGGENEDTSSPVDPGVLPSDDPDNYAPTNPSLKITSVKVALETPKILDSISEKGELMARCEKNVTLSGKYSYKSNKPPFEITAWKVKSGTIYNNGQRVPCILFQDGIEVDFFFDETHFLLEEYPITPKQILLQSLTERFSVRDSPIAMQEVYLGLVNNHFADERINLLSLKERAEEALRCIRDGLPTLLAHRIGKCIALIKGVPSESDFLAQILLNEAPDLLFSFQDETEDVAKVLSYISEDTLINLIENMPEEFLDNKVFKLPYTKISFPDTTQNERLRRISLDKITSYLKDLKMLQRSGSKPSKAELIRFANTLQILEDRLV